jgi:hypothetical protein
MSLAAVAEMADRVYYQNWDDNLDAVLQEVFPDSQQTGVLPDSHDTFAPEKFELFQNYPNPFNPETTIHYQLAQSGKVSIQIYNVNGQLIRTLLNTEQPAGFYTTKWNGKDDAGKQMGTGVYFCLLKTNNDQTQINKMMLIK